MGCVYLLRSSSRLWTGCTSVCLMGGAEELLQNNTVNRGQRYQQQRRRRAAAEATSLQDLGTWKHQCPLFQAKWPELAANIHDGEFFFLQQLARGSVFVTRMREGNFRPFRKQDVTPCYVAKKHTHTRTRARHSLVSHLGKY